MNILRRPSRFFLCRGCRCSSLPQWVPPKEDQNDPGNVIKRFEHPAKQAAREAVFGSKTPSRALKTITGEQAWREYGLSSSDLSRLPYTTKMGVVFDSSGVTKLFNKFEVEDAAIVKFGGVETVLLNMEQHLNHRDVKSARRKTRVRGKTGMFSFIRSRRGLSIQSPTNEKNIPVGTHAVNVAIAGNSLVLISKIGAYACSGSGAVLSEAIHSGADVMNQGLLYYGLRRSSLKSDGDHPYGYGFETYVWSMISAVGSFFLGAGASVLHGAHTIYNVYVPHALPEPLLKAYEFLTHEEVIASQAPIGDAMVQHAEMLVSSAPITLTVLGFAGILESYTCWVAWGELSREAKKSGMSTRAYIVDGPDPVNVAVFLEDAIAVGGVAMAVTGIGLTVVTGNVVYDALGSIGVGALMGGVSFFIVTKNRRLLGQAVPDSKMQVVELLLSDEAVMSCQDVKAVRIRPGVCRFKAEIQFNPTTLANKYIDQHPDNLPGIVASFTRALGNNMSSSTITSSEALLSQVNTTPQTSELSIEGTAYLRNVLGKAMDDAKTADALRVQLHRYSRMLLLTLALEVDRLEQLIRKHHPEYHYIDLEIL